jgi:regulatory protein
VRRPGRPDSGPPEGDERAVRTAALAQLARRDFGRAELRERLVRKGCAPAIVDAVLGQLEAERLLSDARYVESAVRAHAGRGHGPVRVRAELRQRGLEAQLVDAGLRESDVDWAALAVRLRRRRFGAALPGDARERAKQARFLQYRGFTAEQIRAALGAGWEPEEPLTDSGPADPDGDPDDDPSEPQP